MKISETTPTTPAGEMCDTCGIDGVAACSWEQCPRRTPSHAPAEAGRVSQHTTAGAGASAHDIDFWDAVNRYVVACGGDPSKRTVSSIRMTAVSDIERLRAQPGPANNREPPHCSTCECGMERPANAEVDARDAALAAVQKAIDQATEFINSQPPGSTFRTQWQEWRNGMVLAYNAVAAMSASAASEGEK